MSHFAFNFDFDEEQVDNAVVHEHPREEPTFSNEPFTEVSLNQLLDTLPPLITFSPLDISLSSGGKLTLHRRDLFDVRFQLISQDDEVSKESDASKQQTVLDFIDNPSDLIPNVYEGGLKTWECSTDMVDYLDRMQDGRFRDMRGKRVLELGCGTAIPSLYLLHKIFSLESNGENDRQEVHLHLQDYNIAVLELVTIPNVLLTWYMSPASSVHRSAENDGETSHTELSVTPLLVNAFFDSLKALRVSLRFFAGSWANFDLLRCGGKYDVVLTSETIYRTESIRSLISAMMMACCGPNSPSSDDVENHGEPTMGKSSLISPTRDPYLCLVASKLIYFGVGGCASDFIRAIEMPGISGDRRGEVETVWERKIGVGRRVMRVRWRL